MTSPAPDGDTQQADDEQRQGRGLRQLQLLRNLVEIFDAGRRAIDRLSRQRQC